MHIFFYIVITTFSKLSGRNPGRNLNLGIGGFCYLNPPPPHRQNILATPLGAVGGFVQCRRPERIRSSFEGKEAKLKN